MVSATRPTGSKPSVLPSGSMKPGTRLALARYALITGCCVPAAAYWGLIAAGRPVQEIGALVGSVHALVLSPLIATLLWRKRLLIAVPTLLLGTTVVVVGLSAIVPIPPLTFIVGTLAYLGLATGLGILLPNLVRDRPRRGRCYWCNYNLRGLAGDICPECGEPHTPRDADGFRLQDYHIQRP